MGFLDKLLGREEPQQLGARRNNDGVQPLGASTWSQSSGSAPRQPSDKQALARYRYMLQTAPPDAIEQAHEEAFAKLTPEQRRMALEQLAQATPESERSALNDDAGSLARAATRAEMRQPGTMERTFGGGGMSSGMGGLMAGGLLTGIAGAFIGSAIAHSFFSNAAVAQDYSQSEAAQETGDTSVTDEALAGNVDVDGNSDPYGDPGDAVDPYGDPGAADTDFGGDFGGDF
jgi:hypothetical protein